MLLWIAAAGDQFSFLFDPVEAGLCAEEETQIALQRVVQRVEKAENAAKLSGKSLENLTSDEINVYLQRESKHRPKQGVHRILSAIKKEENQNE